MSSRGKDAEASAAAAGAAAAGAGGATEAAAQAEFGGGEAEVPGAGQAGNNAFFSGSGGDGDGDGYEAYLSMAVDSGDAQSALEAAARAAAADSEGDSDGEAGDAAAEAAAAEASSGAAEGSASPATASAAAAAAATPTESSAAASTADAGPAAGGDSDAAPPADQGTTAADSAESPTTSTATSPSKKGRVSRKSSANKVDAQTLAQRAFDEEVGIHEWASKDKHVFILSIAGKPIYSRYGNEDKLASIMGVMQALVSFVQEEKDQLRSIVAGQHRFVFMLKGPILVVMVASTGESVAQMVMQMTYVYSQIIFVLTHSQLTRIFEQRINYDLRRMLTGTEKFLDSLLDLLDRNPSFFLSAVRCLPMPGSIRDKIGQTLQQARIKDLVFAVLIANNQLITLLRPKKYSLHPADLHLIFNMVSASTSFKTAESWTPLCLPRFNNTGFLHAHVSYIDEDCTACLLLISNNKDAFFELSKCRTQIVQNLSANGCLAAISQAQARSNYRVANLELPDLRHFLYKSKSTAQFTSPALDPPYNLPGEAQRLFRRYQYLHHRIHSQARPLKIYFSAQSKEALLGWVTSGFELYAAFGPLVTKPVAINSVLNLIRWMKKEEDRLFILNSQVF